MYYFLYCLSFVDLCSSTAITPNILVKFLRRTNLIFCSECVAQLFFFVIIIVAECFLLTAMLYDHCVAICRPEMYSVIMSSRLCSLLVLVASILGILSTITHKTAIMKLFSKSHIISHSFCNFLPFLGPLLL